MNGFEQKNLASVKDQGRKNFSITAKNTSPGQYLTFWLVISTTKIQQRYGHALPPELGGAAIRKQKFDHEDDTAAQVLADRFLQILNIPDPPVSIFCKPGALLAMRGAPGGSRSASPSRVCNVKLVIGKFDTGKKEIIYTQEHVSASISATPLVTGLEKTVFSGIFNATDRYVFKRITEQSFDTYEQNNEALEAEYKLVRMGAAIIEEFFVIVGSLG
ncbi:hypothetical protein AAF712_004650 [Marasmius tenuissimus]|uniref:Uncharacterized protein n=1 Tax=Marasmius tenuissimus TaxID=585030 RepID=A0ABR3A2S2_9AGAR